MLSVILILLIGLLLFLSSFISNNTKLFDRRKSILNMITKHGVYVIVINIAIIGLSIWQYQISEQKQFDAEDKAKKESDKRDSIMRSDYAISVERITNNYDSKAKEIKTSSDSNASTLKRSYDISTTNIVKALAEYGLAYNKRTDRVEKLIRNSQSPEPDFNFCTEAFTLKDTVGEVIYVNFNFCSSSATAANINVNCHIVYHLRTGTYLFAGSNNPFPQYVAMTPEQGAGISFSFPRNILKDIREIFVLLKGSYTNKDGSKIFSVNNVYAYDLIKKTDGQATIYYDSKVRELLKTKGIN